MTRRIIRNHYQSQHPANATVRPALAPCTIPTARHPTLLVQPRDRDIGADRGEHTAPTARMAEGRRRPIPHGGPGHAKRPEDEG